MLFELPLLLISELGYAVACDCSLVVFGRTVLRSVAGGRVQQRVAGSVGSANIQRSSM